MIDRIYINGAFDDCIPKNVDVTVFQVLGKPLKIISPPPLPPPPLIVVQVVVHVDLIPCLNIFNVISQT